MKQGAQLAITPQTLNYLGNNQIFETSGYAATIGDVRLFSSFQGVGNGILTKNRKLCKKV